MTSKGGIINTEEPSLDFIRRFQKLLDEDDESDYKVVSSTRQRLDRLLSAEDQVVDISKPSRIMNEQKEAERKWESLSVLASVLAALLFILYSYYLWKQRRRRPKATPMIHPPTINGELLLSKDSNLQESKLISSSVSTVKHDRLLTCTNDDDDGASDDEPQLLAEGSNTSQATSETPHLITSSLDTSVPANMVPLLHASSLPDFNNLTTTTSQILADDNDSIRLFAKMARDIKLAENVLAENGVDRSLAQQLAVSIKTSQALMESQRQLETRRMIVDSHHRNLDRQLSQRQHEESLNAAKYDPNWNEKLERKRDKCWNATTRIVFEVLLIHYLSMMLKPITESFSSSSPTNNLQELLRLAIYAICDCGSSTDITAVSSTTDALFSTRATMILLDLLGLDYIFAIDAGLCYGYCLISFGCTAIFTATVHQGLRILSAPLFLHHIVNLAALASWGPNMMLSMETLLLPFSKIHAIGIVLLSIYALVQWNYSSCKQRIRQASKSPSVTFSDTLETSLQQLDTLYSHLCWFRYAMIAMFCASLF